MKLKSLILLTVIALTSCSKHLPVVEFISEGSDGKLRPSNEVALVEGRRFGWLMYLNSPNEVKWKEVVIFPQKDSVSNAKDTEKSTSTIEKEQIPIEKNGKYIIGNTWIVQDGDPVGQGKFSIYLEGRLVKEFLVTFK